MAESKLCDFISKNIEPIIRTWEAFARDIIAAHLPSPLTADARDHVKGMLLAIIADMNRPQTASEQSEKSLGRGPRDEAESEAEQHGALRQIEGFDIAEEVSEFRALRAAVLRLWNDSSTTALQSDVDGLMRFNEAVDRVLGESVARFATDKVRAARRLEKDLSQAMLMSDMIIESAPGGFFMVDEEAKLARWNRDFSKETGLSDEQLRGRSILSCVLPDDRELAAAKILTAFATGYAEMEVRMATANKGTRLYLNMLRRLEVEGAPYVTSFGIDVTRRKQAEEALKGERDFFDAMIESTPGAFYVVDREGTFCRWNSYLNRLTGLTNQELQNRTSLLTIQNEDRPLAAATMKKAFEDGYAQAELHILTRDRGARPFILSARRFQVGDTAYLVGIGVDTTDRRAKMEALEHQARTDPLTQVANRGYFLELAKQELARCRRYGHPLSLWMLDIDHFKDVNDTYGHHAGDLALQALMVTSRQALRDWDIVGRMGGEEFAVLLPETDATQSLHAAERLRQAVAATEVPIEEGKVVHLTVSTGVAMAGGDDTEVEMLLSRADAALYEAKRSGRDKVCVAGGGGGVESSIEDRPVLNPI